MYNNQCGLCDSTRDLWRLKLDTPACWIKGRLFPAPPLHGPELPDLEPGDISGPRNGSPQTRRHVTVPQGPTPHIEYFSVAVSLQSTAVSTRSYRLAHCVRSVPISTASRPQFASRSEETRYLFPRPPTGHSAASCHTRSLQTGC